MLMVLPCRSNFWKFRPVLDGPCGVEDEVRPLRGERLAPVDLDGGMLLSPRLLAVPRFVQDFQACTRGKVLLEVQTEPA
jgi:hypothetical protein